MSNTQTPAASANLRGVTHLKMRELGKQVKMCAHSTLTLAAHSMVVVVPFSTEVCNRE